MYYTEDLHVLLGNTIEIPEVEYDDEEIRNNTIIPVINNGVMEYEFSSIVSHMKDPDFKSNYIEVKGRLKNYQVKQQQLLAYSILEQLKKKYDFEFSIKFDLHSQEEINELYKFIEFLEYDNEKFIVSVWKYLKPSDTNWIQLKNFSEHNSVKIFSEFEKQLQSHYFSELIADFLRTYNKENLIEWFIEKSHDVYTTILIELREEK